MGIIQRQALRNTIINFVGAGFGAVTRISMPIVLTEGQIGLLTLLDTLSGIFVTVFSLGFDQILYKLFPGYRDEDKGHHGFLLFGLLLSLIGIGLSWICYVLFGEYYLDDSPGSVWFRSFSFLVFPLIFFRIIFKNLEGYARMLFNTVIGVFLETFVSKVLLVSGLAAFALSMINFDYLVYVFAINLCLPGFIILIYSFFRTRIIVMPHKDIMRKDRRKELSQLMLFGILMGASGTIVLYIDSLMVNKMISIEALGIYTTFYFAARLLVIPSSSIGRISIVILAESWKNKDWKNIRNVYEKSCLNQLLLGAYMFGVGWACIDTAMSLTPKFASYAEHQYIFFFLGLGLLVEMATGVNSAIIATSDKYKYNTYFNIVLAIFIVILNYFLIIEYNIEGAAIASMIAMVFVNLLRWVFLVREYQLQPFKLPFLKALLFSLVFILGCHFLEYDMNPWMVLVINVVGLTILFWGLVILFRLSPDINQWLAKVRKRFIG